MDLLCFFARQLLDMFPHLRLVLMSATICTDVFRRYFSVKEQPLFVGIKRFPLSVRCARVWRLRYRGGLRPMGTQNLR